MIGRQIAGLLVYQTELAVHARLLQTFGFHLYCLAPGRITERLKREIYLGCVQ